jgi:peptide/nickel transport system substrate-binding protein
MKSIRICIKMGLFLSIVIVMLVFCLAPTNALAEIKEIKIGIGIDADTLNPQEQTTSLIANICDLIYDTLFWQTLEGKLEPRLATKYEVSQDGLTYTVHLRKGAKFSDGTTFNAKVMKLTLDRALDPKMRVPTRFFVAMVKEATVVDDYTFQIKLKYPFAPFPENFSWNICSPISAAAIEKYGEEVRKNPIGAGPYVLKEWVAGDRIVLVRNENYYGSKPTVARLTFKIVADAATREALLRTGQIDICYQPIPADVAALKADPKITVDMPLSTKTVFMGMNCQKGVTKDKLVRQAFNYAVDKNAIVKKILFDVASPMEGPCSPILFGYHKMAHQYEYNPEKAKTLLKKANFPFDQVIHMRTPTGYYMFDKQISEAIQAYLQAIGVKVELRTYDWPTYVADLVKPLDKTELELFLLGWNIRLDADMALYGMFHSSTNPPKGLASAFYSNPEYDKMIEATRLEQNPEKRLALFKRASELVWDDCPWIWLHTEKFVIAYSSKIKGLVITNTMKIYPTYVTME